MRIENIIYEYRYGRARIDSSNSSASIEKDIAFYLTLPSKTHGSVKRSKLKKKNIIVSWGEEIEEKD